MAEQLAAIARRRRRAVHVQGVVRQGEPDVGPSFRGPGLDEGLRRLAAIKSRAERARSSPTFTSRHRPRRPPRSPTCCRFRRFSRRQTDLLVAAGQDRARRQHQEGPVPRAERHATCDRQGRGGGQRPRRSSPSAASSFGYHNLVVDMRAFPMMRALGVPVVFDVTHSLQLPAAATASRPGSPSTSSRWLPPASAAGVDGVFLEVHEDPSRPRATRRTRCALDLRAPNRLAASAHHRRSTPSAKPPQGVPSPWLTSPLARKVLETEAHAILGLVPRLDGRFVAPSTCSRLRGPRDRDRHGQVRASSRRKSPRRSRAPARPRFFSIRPKRFTATSASSRATTSSWRCRIAARLERSCVSSRAIRRLGAKLDRASPDGPTRRSLRPRTSRSTAASPRKPAQ